MKAEELLAVADLANEVDRLMLADAMEDAGRDHEAMLLREEDPEDIVNLDGHVHGVWHEAEVEELDDLACPWCGGDHCEHMLVSEITTHRREWRNFFDTDYRYHDDATGEENDFGDALCHLLHGGLSDGDGRPPAPVYYLSLAGWGGTPPEPVEYHDGSRIYTSDPQGVLAWWLPRWQMFEEQRHAEVKRREEAQKNAEEARLTHLAETMRVGTRTAPGFGNDAHLQRLKARGLYLARIRNTSVILPILDSIPPLLSRINALDATAIPELRSVVQAAGYELRDGLSAGACNHVGADIARSVRRRDRRSAKRAAGKPA